MSEKIGKASLRDASIGTGVAVDKILALTGHVPNVNIANIWMPSEEEREERCQVHAKLDAIARRLNESCEPKRAAVEEKAWKLERLVEMTEAYWLRKRC
jgi:hypothetical protein